MSARNNNNSALKSRYKSNTVLLKNNFFLNFFEDFYLKFKKKKF